MSVCNICILMKVFPRFEFCIYSLFGRVYSFIYEFMLSLVLCIANSNVLSIVLDMYAICMYTYMYANIMYIIYTYTFSSHIFHFQFYLCLHVFFFISTCFYYLFLAHSQTPSSSISLPDSQNSLRRRLEQAHKYSKWCII